MARYTTLHTADADTVCSAYGLRLRTVVPLHGGMANSSFLAHCIEGDYVLTVLDNHTHASAEHLARLTEFLEGQGLDVPPLRRTSTGALTWPLADIPVIVKRFVPGTCIPVLPDQHLAAAGAALARLHLLGLPSGALDLPRHTRRLPPDAETTMARFTDRSFAAWLSETLHELTGLFDGYNEDRLIHGDLFADNIVITPDQRLVILDWETACLDDPLLDLGMAAVGLARIDGHFVPSRAHTLIHGYTAVRPLAPGEQTRLRDMATYASVVIAYHRYLRHHITWPDAAKQHLYREIPPFTAELRDTWPALRTTATAPEHGA